ncbi:MAG: CDP-glycerol glycerophosphotransferase family protein [Spirochaetaceae bacterium]|nr:CDP-glycerol glycerophosphotransferase family protein [Spirochaetaceae bacterium]
MFYSLYIDPGTGSMLFSILMGAAAASFFAFRALIIKAKAFFSGGRRVAEKNSVPYIIYCEGKQYFNVFKTVLEEAEIRKTSVVYLTSAKDDPVFGMKFEYIKPEYIGEGAKAFARLNMLNADFVLMTTPGINVYQLKRSPLVKHYSHILHAPSDAVMYRLFGLDYFDSILLTGSYQARDIRALEKLRGLPEKQLVVVGCPYLDVYASKISALSRVPPPPPFTVIVSPSWGPSALLSKYGERLLSPLAKTSWRIIVRPHPQSKKSEASLLESLAKKYKDFSNIEWDYEQENIYSLSKSDVMISDFSGVIFDYIFLFNKPVLYVKQNIDLRPYDADDLYQEEAGGPLENLWQFKTVREIGVELKEESFEQIEDVIKASISSASLNEARASAKETAWERRGESGRLIFDFMTGFLNAGVDASA